MPTGLRESNKGAAFIDLSWDAVQGASHYQVYRDNMQIATPDNNFYNDSGLKVNTTYNYSVKACNASGCSLFSTNIMVTTNNITAPPSVVTNLQVAASSDTSITIIWETNEQAQFYRVNRYDNAAVLLASSNINITTSADIGLEANTIYQYKVQACNSIGCSDLATSNFLQARTRLETPANLQVNNITANSLTLNWEAVVGVNKYQIYRNNEVIDTTNDTSVIDSNLMANTSYIYKVRACNEYGCSVFSTEQMAITIPTKPVRLQTNNITIDSISFSWNATADYYLIYKAAMQIATIDDPTTDYIDTGLAIGSSYNYYVRACNNSGCSVSSDILMVSTIPAVPTNLQVIDASSDSIMLSWDAMGVIKYYSIYRGNTEIATTNITIYTDNGLSADTSYTYRIKACNDSGCSASSDGFTAYTSPMQPTGLQASNVTTTSLELSWEAVAGVTSYQIYRDSSFIATIDAPTITYTDSNLAVGAPYNYQMAACKANRCSPLSDELMITTKFVVPTNLQFSITTLMLSWDEAAGATDYEVYRNDMRINVMFTTNSYTESNLMDGRYKYQVRACNENGCSAFSVPLNTVIIDPICTTTTDILDACKITEGMVDWQLIFNVEQLQAIDVVANLGKNYLLVNDIDASATKNWNGGAGFDPIGDNTNKFSGIFDGAYHTITNLFINREIAGNIGLFGVNEGTIDSLGVSAMVTNEHFSVMDIFNPSYGTAGGLIGRNEGIVRNSYAVGHIVASVAGGLVGQNSGIITNSYAVGATNSPSISSVVSHVIGGLVGNNDRGTIKNSYAKSSVGSSVSNIVLGSLVGNNLPSSTIKNNYAVAYPSTASGISSVGGVGLRSIVRTVINNLHWAVTYNDGTGTEQLTIMEMQANSGTILNLASEDGMDINDRSAWVFTPINDYPRLRSLNADGTFGDLLPILATALDATSLAFTANIASADGLVWHPQKTISYDGIDSIRSGNIDDNGYSCITTTASGSSVSFYWKVSSEQNADYLRFYVGGSTTATASISGEQDWVQYTHNTAVTNAELKWCYEKDESDLAGFDAGWLDQLVIE